MIEFSKQPAKRTHIRLMFKGCVISYDGSQYVYIRTPNGGSSIYATKIENNKIYRLPVNDSNNPYFDVIGYCDVPENIVNDDIEKLVKGDLFVINHHSKGSGIYRFERFTPTRIIATNPMNNKEVRISKLFMCIKIENLPY